MVREEESGIGSGRNDASVKAFATQSDALCISTQHAYFENRVPLAESGERVVDYRDSPMGARIMTSRLVSQLHRYLREAPSDGLTSSNIFAGQGRRYHWPPWTWPLLAAFATITAMFKCFNSMKIGMMPR
jgi:hypothetical protein